MRLAIRLGIGFSGLMALVFSGCSSGPKAFTKGEYDDPNRVELLDDKFNEADMQQMADQVVREIVACRSVANAQTPPTVIVNRVQNRTEEHIDTVSMTDMIQNALTNSGKVQFVDKEARDAMSEEIDYQASGNVSGPSAKKRGKQIGAGYFLGGAIATNVQEVGNDKLIYYKLSMNLTDIEKGLKVCTVEKQVRKKYKKRSIGL